MRTLLRQAACLLCGLAIATFSIHAAQASKRVALVIGNAKYEHADTLNNTINDANAVAALLTKAGFDVVDERRNVGVVEFKRAVREFLISAANADIAVVYYSGHGIEVGGTNYLIPVDARLASDFDVDDEAIPLDRLIQATQPAQKLSLIILDACRDNPFLHATASVAATRSLANRMVSVQPSGTDTLIAYAAKAGSVSYDGNGTNSPFTTALVKYIAEPGVDIRIALGKVRDDVLASTGGRQEPFVYGSLGGADISLVPAPVAPKAAPAPIAADPNVAIAKDYEMAERVGTRQGWQSFLAVHGSGFYAELARAQIEKAGVVEPPKPQKIEKDVKIEADRPAAAPVKIEAQLPPEPARVKDEREAALTPTLACKRDEEQLAKLRVNPSMEQAELLARGLTCEDLRPQVQRLMESLGVAPVAVKPSPPPTLQAKADTLTPDQSCARDAERLAKLRVDPTAEQAEQLARELGCDTLRPQVQRLMESLGVEPPAGKTVQPASLSKGVGEIQSGAPGQPAAPSPGNEQACRRDGEALVHLRANPDREAAARFARNLKCEDLRAQAARLLESLGD